MDAAVTSPPGDRLSEELRGFGPVGIAAILAIVVTGNVFVAGYVVLPVGAALVLLWAWRSRTPWSAIGYIRPRSWAATVAGGIVFGVALKLVLKALVMPMLGAPPVNASYHFLAGNRELLPQAIWAMLVAGFGEETVFRGFMFERLGRLFGTRTAARVAIVVVTAAAFAAAHYSTQGLPGTEQAAITGLVFGAIAALTGTIVMLMIAHAAFDLFALALIYWNLEPSIAHLIFR